MGRYYALADGEAAEVADGDRASTTCRAAPATRCRHTRRRLALALADKLDTLAGIFAIGQKPSGTKDPFGLRRAAIGVLRIVLEKRLELDLRRADRCRSARATGGGSRGATPEPVQRRALRLHDGAAARLVPRATAARRRHAPRCSMRCWRRSRRSPLDFDARLKALVAFLAAAGGGQPHGGEQAHRQHPEEIRGRRRCAASTPTLLREPRRAGAARRASQTCARAVRGARWRERDYARGARSCSRRCGPQVDAFFDSVMVNDRGCRAARQPPRAARRTARAVHAHRRPVAPAGLSRQRSMQLLRFAGYSPIFLFAVDRSATRSSSCSPALVPAVPRPLRAGARLGALRAGRAALDLRPGLSRRGPREPAAPATTSR